VLIDMGSLFAEGAAREAVPEVAGRQDHPSFFLQDTDGAFDGGKTSATRKREWRPG